MRAWQHGFAKVPVKTTTAVDVSHTQIEGDNTNSLYELFSSKNVKVALRSQLETSSASGFTKWVSVYEILLRSTAIPLVFVEYPRHPHPTRVPKKNLVLKSSKTVIFT